MPVFCLDDSLIFPPPVMAEESGLLAIGGDLRPQRLLNAYAQGIFPWYGDDSPILWYSPDPRMVLDASEIHVGRSLRKVIQRRQFVITLDTAFETVVHCCAEISRPMQNSTWITEDMKKAYRLLHRLGFAHSVEAWFEGQLAGGLYGISLGAAFFGESMFSRVNNASKVAFVALARQLARWSIEMIDCQVPTEHLERFGARKMERSRFLKQLALTQRQQTRKGPWSLDIEIKKSYSA